MERPAQDFPSFALARSSEATAILSLGGTWRSIEAVPDSDPVTEQIVSSKTRTLKFDATRLASWDTSLLVFLQNLSRGLAERNIAVENDGLPAQVNALLKLSTSGEARERSARCPKRESFIEELGQRAERSRA
jgi:ABC-type transporter Mla MlaB component